MDNIEVNGEIYVNIPFLRKHGISTNTVYNGMMRNKSHSSKHYDSFQDPIDKRRKWIKYCSIPDLMFKKHNLPSAIHLKKKLEFSKGDNKDQLINECFQFAYTAGYRSYLKEYKGCFTNINEYINFARTHSIFKEILRLRQNGFKLANMLEPYRQLECLVFETNNLRSFYRKINEFKEKGSTALIHSSRGESKDIRKVTRHHERELKRLYSNPKQYSGREIHQKLNEWCIVNGYKKISLSSVKKIISDPYIRNICNTKRNGEEWFRLHIEPFKLRHEPAENGELWQLDGSRAQFAFLDDKRQISFLILFVVMDVHSRKIVGYSLDKSENHVMVIEAIKNAVKNTGYTPNTMVTDNGAALKHERFRILEEQFSFFGTRTIRHAPGKPRQKGHIERFYSTLQTAVCKHYPGYLGEGVKSKRENGRPSKKIIVESFQKKNLRQRHELVDLIELMINEYNNLKINEIKAAPFLKYAIAKQNKYAIDINENDFALLFWKRVPEYHVRNSMVILTEGSFRNETFQYIINDRKSKYELNSRRLIVLYRKEDRSMVKLFDENETFIMDIPRSEKIKTVQDRDRIKKYNGKVTSMKKNFVDKDTIKKSDENQVFKVPASFDLLLVKTKGNE